MRIHSLPALALIALLAACTKTPQAPPTAAVAQAPALIARSVLFGNPERTQGSISPDGKWLGYIAPRDGVLNVWVAPSDQPDQARAVTQDTLRGIRDFTFAYDGNHVLFGQDVGGDENFQVFAVDLSSGEQKTLSPAGSRAAVDSLSPRRPDEVVLSVNDRNKEFFDLVRVNLKTGAQERLVENDGYAGFILDRDLALRYATKSTEDGGFAWFVRDGNAWKPWSTVAQADALTTNILGLTADGTTVYVIDSRERDTAGLFAIDTTSNERRLLFENARADVGGATVQPQSDVIQAVSVNYLRNEWTALDPELAGDLAALKAIGDGEVGIAARTLDDSRWVVSFVASDASAKYYLYDRAKREAVLWFDTRPALADVTLAPMHAREISSRDGLTLVSYLSLPPGTDADGNGVPAAPLPMVLLVHGGPWGRDSFGYVPTHQWLANRGYAVLSVNFRASQGFGKQFLNAGDLQWGRKMHDDLLDAVAWAEAQGIAKSDQVAIMGGSYGGYATLAGLSMTPTEFACGVDIVGPSNLITLLNSIPPYWKSFREQFYTRMGNPNTEQGLALLRERSPLTYADQIVRPLLIGQGQNDPRVNVAESDQIVAAMQAKSIPVTYVLYPDEGHGFARPPNRMSFNAVTEEFLGKCLGGRVEPVGTDFAGSTIQVPAGAELLPGTQAALPVMAPDAPAAGTPPAS